jgi:hypothetical protein
LKAEVARQIKEDEARLLKGEEESKREKDEAVRSIRTGRTLIKLNFAFLLTKILN